MIVIIFYIVNREIYDTTFTEAQQLTDIILETEKKKFIRNMILAIKQEKFLVYSFIYVRKITTQL